MKKGFTLAELMGVIIIIGIIATVVTVTIDKSIKSSRYNTCIAQEKNIIEAAKTWSIDHADQLPKLGSATKTISVKNDLINEGYLDENIKSPMTENLYKNINLQVKISVSTGTYETCYYKNEVRTCQNHNYEGNDYQYELTNVPENEKCSK